ncbi:TIR domain-containing protein [Gilvibacter sp.]|jgi:hypothetical protein|uniref:TIR domain-containing protein n=1 Tax=Gilvibacter sp. TaxID=2729997 RepID=UPI003B52F63F
MGRKIFVSYKYADSLVEALPSVFFVQTTARHYVDELQELLEEDDHIYKGENDDESLEGFKDTTIQSKLRTKIFDSSTTIVFVSKGMKERFTAETDQWIPWEVAYSMKVLKRGEKTSGTNAVLAVVLPDENGSYEYYIEQNEACGSRTLKTNFLFQILKDNMFNVKNPQTRECNGNTIYSAYSSYIHTVQWSDFKDNVTKYIDIAKGIQENLENYDLCKTVK